MRLGHLRALTHKSSLAQSYRDRDRTVQGQKSIHGYRDACGGTVGTRMLMAALYGKLGTTPIPQIVKETSKLWGC